MRITITDQEAFALLRLVSQRLGVLRATQEYLRQKLPATNRAGNAVPVILFDVEQEIAVLAGLDGKLDSPAFAAMFGTNASAGVNPLNDPEESQVPPGGQLP